MITAKARVGAAVLAVLVAATAACSPPDAPAPQPAPTSAVPSASPDADALAADAKAKIDVVLAAQAAAFNKGDLAGFLAAAAGDRTIEAALKRRFTALRAMKVADVTQKVGVGPGPTGDPGRWSVEVSFGYCVGGPGCRSVAPLVGTTWEEGPEGFRLVNLGTTGDGPRPWEADDLVVRVGKRVIVATTKAHAAAATTALPIAEKAATVADTFTLGGARPHRYVVYLAGKKEWKIWYGNTYDDSTSGYAMPALSEGTDLVVRLDAYPIERTGKLLRHEMTHLASLSNLVGGDSDGSAWWLSEGLASLAGENGADPRDHPVRDGVRDYLRKSPYRGDLATVTPGSGDTDAVISAKYGLGYYATRCIDDRYGRKKLMKLFEALLRNDKEGVDVAPALLGTTWKKVESTCLAYTRSAVGL